jgi:hypothetical protein
MKTSGLLKSLAVLVVLAMVMAPSLAMSATTYDLLSSWSNTANPNGPWEYSQGSTPLPSQTGGIWGSSYAFAPGNVAGNFLPAFWNNGDSIITHSVDGANGNPALGESTLTWTSPAAGIISISGAIWYAHGPTVARSNDFILSLGGTGLTQGTVSGTLGESYADAKAQAITFSFSGLSVTNGEVLSLVVERSPGQQYGSESAINLTVMESPVPLPAGLLLLGPGLAGLAVIRRRLKK